VAQFGKVRCFRHPAVRIESFVIVSSVY